MKPSPYFADRFRFFFKRFAREQALKRWFLKQAGEESGEFNFPASLQNHPKTLVILHRELTEASAFMKALPQGWFQNVLFLAHESLHALVEARRSEAIYYSDLECRFGEDAFDEIQEKIKSFAPTVTLYLREPFFPALYLAKKLGGACRIGFGTESLYPFLNLSLHPDKSSEAELIAKYYGVSK